MITNRTELLDSLLRLVQITGHPSQNLPAYVRVFLQACENDCNVSGQRIREVLLPAAPDAETNINALCGRWDAWSELIQTAVPPGRLRFHDASSEADWWRD
jgi:hypothetical protein